MLEYFTFNGICSKDLNMFIVNNGDGYILNQLMPQPIHNYEIKKRVIVDRGSYYGERTISFRVMVETKDHIRIMNAITRWLNVKDLKPLILSREPYKQYYVKRTGELSPTFHPNYIVMDLQFIALDYLAYSVFKAGEIHETMLYDEKYESSGIIGNSQYTFSNPEINKTFNIYHGGNADECKPRIIIKGTFNTLVLENRTTGEKCTLNYELDKDEIIVDCARKIVLFNGIYSVVGHDGDFITLKGRDSLFDEFTSLPSGMNEIFISSPNPYNIEEITFDFRYVYY